MIGIECKGPGVPVDARYTNPPVADESEPEQPPLPSAENASPSRRRRCGPSALGARHDPKWCASISELRLIFSIIALAHRAAFTPFELRGLFQPPLGCPPPTLVRPLLSAQPSSFIIDNQTSRSPI